MAIYPAEVHPFPKFHNLQAVPPKSSDISQPGVGSPVYEVTQLMLEVFPFSSITKQFQLETMKQLLLVQIPQGRTALGQATDHFVPTSRTKRWGRPETSPPKQYLSSFLPPLKAFQVLDF